MQMSMPFTDSPFQIGWKQVAAAVGIPAVAGLITYFLWKEDKEQGEIYHSKFYRTELVVPGDKIGAVIGQRGSVVREIERQHGAKVRVIAPQLGPPTNDAFEEEQDGRVIIQGLRENVYAAEIAVRKIIAQTAPVLTENVYIPKASIGFVIGKKGASIRELAYLSGARPIIGKTGNDMEVVTLKGRPVAIEMAKNILRQKLDEFEELRKSRPKWKNEHKQDSGMDKTASEDKSNGINETVEKNEDTVISNDSELW